MQTKIVMIVESGENDGVKETKQRKVSIKRFHHWISILFFAPKHSWQYHQVIWHSCDWTWQQGNI